MSWVIVPSSSFSIRRVHTLSTSYSLWCCERINHRVLPCMWQSLFRSEVIMSRCLRVSGALRVRASVGMVCSMLEAGAALFSSEVLQDCTRMLHVGCSAASCLAQGTVMLKKRLWECGTNMTCAGSARDLVRQLHWRCEPQDANARRLGTT